jgi:hypothetical protein
LTQKPISETTTQTKRLMKKALLTLALAVVSVAAMAQGRVQFVNDGLHNYYFTASASGLLAGDQGLAGLATPLGGVLPSGVALRADLYGGTSAGSLTLISSTTLSSATPGRQNTSVVVTPFAAGVPAFFQVQIRDANFATAALSQAGNSYYGSSIIFTVNPANSPATSSIINHGGIALSTWTDGTYDLGGGQFGAIMIQANPVPEPTSMALAGLGAASLLIFRRRK